MSESSGSLWPRSPTIPGCWVDPFLCFGFTRFLSPISNVNHGLVLKTCWPSLSPLMVFFTALCLSWRWVLLGLCPLLKCQGFLGFHFSSQTVSGGRGAGGDLFTLRPSINSCMWVIPQSLPPALLCVLNISPTGPACQLIVLTTRRNKPHQYLARLFLPCFYHWIVQPFRTIDSSEPTYSHCPLLQ